MENISIPDIEPDVLRKRSARRQLSDAVGASDVAINHYRLAPGEGFPGGLHAHMDQEEVFVMLEGRATFETMTGEVAVEEGEVIRFSPGEFHSGKNTSDTDLVALGMGAPRDTTDVRIPVGCPECGDDDLQLNVSGGDEAFLCPSCESEQIPRDCPHCGHGELALTRRAGRTVTVCRRCDSVFESPPLQD